MILGERGQITIPIEYRRRFRLEPGTAIEIVEEQGQLILRKKMEKEPPAVDLSAWVGALEESLSEESVDTLIDDLRGS